MDNLFFFEYKFKLKLKIMIIHHSTTLILKMKKKNTPIDSMIDNFLEAPKIMDYENTIYDIAPRKHFHPLSLFQNKY